MSAHKNARLTLHSRTVLVRRVFGGRADAAKWVARFRTEGIASLRTDPPGRTSNTILLQNTSFAGAKPCGTSDGPASRSELGISPSTVSRTLHRPGLSRIKDIDPSRRRVATSPADLAR